MSRKADFTWHGSDLIFNDENRFARIVVRLLFNFHQHYFPSIAPTAFIDMHYKAHRCRYTSSELPPKLSERRNMALYMRGIKHSHPTSVFNPFRSLQPKRTDCVISSL